MQAIRNIQVSEGSVTEPVILSEAKSWATVDHADHDTLLTSMIKGARQDIEQELNIKVVASSVVMYVDTTTNTEKLSQFPYAMSLVQVENLVVSNIQDGEVDETLTLNEDYYFNSALKLGEGTFKLEYDIAPIVPQAIKEAIMMLVAYRYNNRGDQEKQHGLPEDIERKISRYRQIWL